MRPLTYEAARYRADHIVDGCGMPIDPKIKELVISFWMLGIATEMSCQGHARRRGLPYPWISFGPGSARKAMRVVMHFNLKRTPSGRQNKNVWVFHPRGMARYFTMTPWDVRRPLRAMQKDADELAQSLRDIRL